MRVEEDVIKAYKGLLGSLAHPSAQSRTYQLCERLTVEHTETLKQYRSKIPREKDSSILQVIVLN